MQSPSPQLKSTIVRAGAGAGKTTELTARVIDYARNFKQMQGHWPRVVVSTFTRKATQELRERLIRKACEEKDWNLLQYVSSTSQLHISTIHGVLSLFLRRYGRLAGLDPGFSIISDLQARTQLRRLLRQKIFERPEFGLLLEEYRVNELLTILPRHYSLWILSNKSARALSLEEAQAIQMKKFKELADQLSELCQFLSRSNLSEDYQEFCRQLTHVKTGLQNSSFEEMDSVLGEWPKRPDGRKKANKIFDADQNQHIDSVLKEGQKLLQEAFLEWELWPRLRELHQAYDALTSDLFTSLRQQKLSQGQLQMEDLELFSYEIVASHPELAKVFSQDWDYWLIDEYQDTSPLQDDLIEKLKGGQPAYFVGDPQQSIYLFRGARFENFEDKMKVFERRSEEISFKTRHYRSAGELLEFFNDFFTTADSRFLSMQPHREVQNPDRVVAKFYNFDKAQAKELPEIEAIKTAEIINSFLNSGTRPQDIAILARRGSDLKSLFDFLKARNFPVQLQSGASFQERREILDLNSILKFLVNPHDNANLTSLLRSPWARLLDSEIIEGAYKKAPSLWLGLQSSEELAECESFQGLKLMREKLKTSATSDLIEEWIGNSGFLDWSRKLDPGGRREANIWKWLHSLRKAERQPGFNYLSWLKDFQLVPDLEKDSQEGDALSSLEPDRIQLMTVHAAKGLEFDHVIVPYCGSGRTPPDRSLWCGSLEEERFCLKIKQEEEQKRLATAWAQDLISQRLTKEQDENLRVLYVALTRAKESLSIIWTSPADSLSWAKSIEKWLLRYQNAPSQFFKIEVSNEIPSESYYESGASKGKAPRHQFLVHEGDQAPAFKKISVTQVLEVGEKIEDKPRIKPSSIGLKKWGKAAEGALVHKIFESLKYRDEWNLPELVDKYFSEDKAKIEAGFEWALGLDEPPMERLVREGNVEWGYQYKTPFGLLEGQVDLWGEIPEKNQLWILDYKSGSSKYEESALRQLWLYSVALRKLHPEREILLGVIFPFEQKLTQIVAPAEEPIWNSLGEIQNWPSLKTT